MQTIHKILVSDSRSLEFLHDGSIDLVVTSPPYPMIQMWDGLFSGLSAEAEGFLTANDGDAAFEAMHRELDKTWGELFRVLKDGSLACINIGDATRTVGGRFRLYPNHSRITSAMRSLGFDALPAIVWRKQTNAPNKFMGSGMLPAGAYVTLEHEFILIFRKGGKRDLTAERDRERRGKSAFFWEERNKWFSDLWDFKGAAQELRLSDARARSAAFPFELAYRLINMYSLYEDTVLDPFMGLGTTGCAAVACGRNSVGVEIEGALAPLIMEQEVSFAAAANEILSTRIQSHNDFIESYQQSKGPPKYCSKHHGFPVVTRQETGMRLFRVSGIRRESERDLAACYEPVGMLR